MKNIMLILKDVVIGTLVFQIMFWSFVLTFKELSTVKPNVTKILTGVK